MRIKNIRLIPVLLMGVIAYGQICVAGTWIDDFSDRTLRDWGFIKESDDWVVVVNNERFSFRGKNEDANFVIRNWALGEIQDFTLEMKFMLRQIGLKESGWKISYEAWNKKTWKLEGLVEFTLHFELGPPILGPGTALVFIGASVPAEHVELGAILSREFVADALFAYEKEVWYTLKIEKEGDRYIFSIDDVVLEAVVDLVSIGWIDLHFYGRLSIWLDDFIVTGPNVPNGGPGGMLAVMPAEKLTTTWGKLKARD